MSLQKPSTHLQETCTQLVLLICTYRHTHTHYTTTWVQPTRPPAKHAQRLRFSYKPRWVLHPCREQGVAARALCLAPWRASHKARPHSRLFSHSILTARGSISGRKVRQRSQILSKSINEKLISKSKITYSCYILKGNKLNFLYNASIVILINN